MGVFAGRGEEKHQRGSRLKNIGDFLEEYEIGCEGDGERGE